MIFTPGAAGAAACLTEEKKDTYRAGIYTRIMRPRDGESVRAKSLTRISADTQHFFLS